MWWVETIVYTISLNQLFYITNLNKLFEQLVWINAYSWNACDN